MFGAINTDLAPINKKINQIMKQLPKLLPIGSELTDFKIISRKSNPDLLETAVHLGLSNALDTYFTLGSQFEKRKTFVNAIKFYQLAAIEGDIRAMHNLGVILDSQGNLEGAKTWFEKAIIASGGEHVDAMCNLGGVLGRQGDLEEAKKWFEKAIEASGGKHVNAMYNLGVILDGQGNLEEAKKWYKKAIETSGEKHVNAICNLGGILGRQGNLEEAKKWFEKAIETSGEKDAETMYNLGEILERQGNLEEAKKWFEKSWKEGLNAALLPLALLSPPSQAEVYFREAIRLGIPDASIFYANFLFSQQKQEDALTFKEFYEQNTETDSDEESSISTEKQLPIEAAASSSNEISSPSPVNKITVGEYSDESTFVSHSESETCASTISKKMRKQLERAEKRLKSSMMTPNRKETITQKTYKDVQVSILADAISEVEENELKIQGLISMLANGEQRRGRLEPLQNYKNIYSMRLTKGDRLVFEITEGNIHQNITAIKVIAAKGHYESIYSRLAQTKAAIPVKWSNIGTI